MQQHFVGAMDIFVFFWCQVSSRYVYQKLLKLVDSSQGYSKNKVRRRFWYMWNRGQWVWPIIWVSRSRQTRLFYMSNSMQHSPELIGQVAIYLSLRASRSDSSNVRMSPSRTGPFTLRMIDRLDSSRNSTRTWQHAIMLYPLNTLPSSTTTLLLLLILARYP